MSSYTIQYCRFAVFFLFSLCFSATALARFNEFDGLVEQQQRLIGMSLGELMSLRVATAGKADEKIADIPASVVVMTRSEIEHYGYRTIEEIMQNITGVYGMLNYWCCGVNFGIRGFGDGRYNKQIVVLVDGIEQSTILSHNNMFAMLAVPVEAIDRIELIRGPLSVIYGDGAFFGVVNIITRLPEETSTQYRGGNRVVYSVGNRDTNKLFMRLNDDSDKNDWQYTLNVSVARSEGIDVAYRDLASSLEPPFTDRRTGGKLDYGKKFFDIYLGKGGFSTRFNYHEGYNEGFLFIPDTIENGGIPNTFTANNLQLAYQTDLSSAWRLRTLLTHRHQTIYTDFSARGTSDDKGALEYTNAWDVTAEVNLIYNPNDNLNIISGIEYSYAPSNRDHLHAPGVGLARITADIGSPMRAQALFAQISYQLNPDWRFVLGGRWQHAGGYFLQEYSDSPTAPFHLERYLPGDDHFTPRLAAIWRADDRHTFKLLYGEAAMWPASNQNLNLVEQPELELFKVERINNLELVHLFQISKKLDTTLSVFHSHLNDLIVRDYELLPDNTVKSDYNNSGKITTTGMEALLNWRPSYQWELQLSASYQDTKDRKFDRDASYSPNLLGYLKLIYQLRADTSLALDANYIGSMRPFIPPGGTEAIGDDTPGEFLLGINFHRENWLIPDMFLNLRISNLLNAEVRHPTTVSNRWIDKGPLGAGREILLSVGMDF